MKRILFAFGCLVAGAVSAAGINDALVYDMALVPTSGTVPKTAIYDRLTHSAAKRTTATGISTFSGSTATCGTPDPITITNATVALPAYGNIYMTEPVISFPQTIREVDGKIYVYRQGVLFDNMPVSSNMTVYMRMRLDPSVRSWKAGTSTTTEYNGCEGTLLDFNVYWGAEPEFDPEGKNRARGFSLRLHTQYGMNYLVLNHGYYNSIQWDGYVNMGTGVWFDIALVIETDEAEQKTYARVYGRAGGSKFGRYACGDYSDETVHAHMSKYTIPSVCSFKSKKVSMGVMVGDVGKTAWETIAATNKIAAFRGQCSRFRIYNRPLTTEEIKGLFSEARGGSVQIGSENDSTDEFASDDETSVPDVYNPYTMQSSQMRGHLTAAHPTLTFDLPAKGCNDGICRMLTVTPVSSSIGDSSPTLDVAVNGRNVGVIYPAQPRGRTLYIPGQYIATNPTGCVRYTLTRKGDLTAPLGIDALEFGGGWGEGSHHVQNASDVTDVWLTGNNHSTDTTVGHPYATKYLEWLLYGPAPWDGSLTMSQYTDLIFYVPEDVAKKRTTAYVLGYRYSDRTKSGSYPVLDIYLNHNKFATYTSLPWYTAHTNVFAPGTLKAGYNTLTFSNATTAAAISSSDYFATIFFDYHRFLVEPPPRRGLVFYCLSDGVPVQ